jgi:hypothetical protein
MLAARTKKIKNKHLENPFIFLMGEINGKTIGYLSHSPIIYEQPFTPTTTITTLIDSICYDINEYLDKYPEFNGAQSSNITNINVVIGGGGVVKPDYFRDGFSLINKAQNNILNHPGRSGRSVNGPMLMRTVHKRR